MLQLDECFNKKAHIIYLYSFIVLILLNKLLWE